MILDASVLVAMMRAEPEAGSYARIIAMSPVVRLSAATYLELGIVIDGMRDAAMSELVDRLLDDLGVVIEPVTASQARLGRDAYPRFGKGSGHPARLNFGDCFAYALAREMGEPLLYRGKDFAHTDIPFVGKLAERRRLSELLAAYGTAAASPPP
jgi:ribonuclease VapC